MPLVLSRSRLVYTPSAVTELLLAALRPEAHFRITGQGMHPKACTLELHWHMLRIAGVSWPAVVLPGMPCHLWHLLSRRRCMMCSQCVDWPGYDVLY